MKDQNMLSKYAKRLFQFSIGDATSAYRRAPNQQIKSFNSLLEMPRRRLASCNGGTWRFNSLLEMPAARSVKVKSSPLASFNSLLEMPKSSAKSSRCWKSYTFQFSIGDAGSYGILNVRVFKFFVCVLAWWCLAGLCGFHCLVYR